MVDRFTTMLDCVDVGFLPDGILDRLPAPSQIGAVRVGGIDTNKPRTRAAMAAVTALAVAPDGFTVADLAATGPRPRPAADYTIRQAAYDLRKLRGKQLVIKPGRAAATTSPTTPPAPSPPSSPSATTSSPPSSPASANPSDRPPNTYTRIDRDYDTLRTGLRTLFNDLGIAHRRIDNELSIRSAQAPRPAPEKNRPWSTKMLCQPSARPTAMIGTGPRR